MTVPAEWEDWHGATWAAVADERQTVWVSLGPSPGEPPVDGTEVGAEAIVFADGVTRTARIVDRLVDGRGTRSLEVLLPEEGRIRILSATTPVRFAEPCRALIRQMFSTIVLQVD